MALTHDEKLTGTKLTSFFPQTSTVLRHLRATDTTVKLGEFGVLIGFYKAGEWRRSYIRQLGKILYAHAAIDRFAQAREFADEDYGRIVGSDGKPAAGYWRRAEIVIHDPDSETL
jgi:hypothetical protein